MDWHSLVGELVIRDLVWVGGAPHLIVVGVATVVCSSKRLIAPSSAMKIIIELFIK